MKILHAVTLHTPTNDFGGPMRVAVNLASGLRRAGDDAVMLTLGDGYGTDLPAAVEDVPAHVYRARHVIPAFEVSGITSGRLLARARELVRQADVVHVHLMRDLVTLPVAVAALTAGRPLVLQPHGMVDPTGRLPARVLDAVAGRRVLRRADAVLHLTGTEREGLDAVAGRPLTTHHRLVNGVPAQTRRPGLPDGPPLVLYAARMQTRKRPEDFVAAVPEILRRRPDARFAMAGTDSGALDGALALARSLGVADRIEQLGPLAHDEVLAWMRRAAVYVLPSRDEPFPLSVLEALSVGCPAVVTASNGLAGEVAAAGAGAVVPDASALPDAITALLDAEANDKAGQAGWELINSTFTIDAVVSRLRGIYADVIAAHR